MDSDLLERLIDMLLISGCVFSFVFVPILLAIRVIRARGGRVRHDSITWMGNAGAESGVAPFTPGDDLSDHGNHHHGHHSHGAPESGGHHGGHGDSGGHHASGGGDSGGAFGGGDGGGGHGH